MKIGDDEDTLSAKDALLLWAQNQVGQYNGVSLTSYKDFKNGLALCALIHKNRPKLVNFDELKAGDSLKNLDVAQKAAEKYFFLEQYLTPTDITVLDENSMVVYVSEYYYGIAEMRKIDLAARRIGKVVTYTQKNDELKAEHVKVATAFKEHVSKVEKVLEDRTIDNNMAGAKKRLEDFYKYKAEDKNEILRKQLALEALYNNIAMRLSQGNRPEYEPIEGAKLSDITAVMNHLEETEQERKVALHTELNRQIKLVRLDDSHKERVGKLKEWNDVKDAYLKERETIESVSAAQLNLRMLDAFDKERADLNKTSVVGSLKPVGAELNAEKYERSEEVNTREAEVDSWFETLGQLSEKKRPFLDDALARELYKQKVRLWNKQHVDGHQKLKAWIDDKEKYLNTREEIHSVNEARKHLSLLSSYNKENEAMSESAVVAQKELGKSVLEAKYETEYSSWVFETPEEVKDRESEVDKKWVELAELSAEKQLILDDHLAREEFAAKLRVWNQNHVDRHAKLKAWIAVKEKYLNTREEIHSVTEALLQLAILDAYNDEKENVTESNVAQLKKVGNDILTAKYETKYSSHTYENPDEVKTRESEIDTEWAKLTELSTEKKNVLDDHLAREQYAEKTRALNKKHTDFHEKLSEWIAEKDTYLKAREEIHSVVDAQTHLSLFEAYETDKKSQTEISVANLKKLGAEILARKYETKYSSYVFENPEEITTRETQVDESWGVLSELAVAKKAVLDDHLAREVFADALRTSNSNHEDMHSRIFAWIGEKEKYLGVVEEINSIGDAQTQLTLLEGYEKEKTRQAATSVTSLKKQGKEILEAKYETEHSSHVFENPEQVKEREAAVDEKWTALDTLSAAKKKKLEEDLATEQEKERLRLEFSHLASSFTGWAKDKSETVAARHFGFTLEEVEAFKATLDSDDAALKGEADEKQTEYNDVHTKMTDMGVTENVYTKLGLDDLSASRASLDSAISDSSAAYDKELAKQRANDELCKQFATVADAFAKFINDHKTAITESKASLEDQLKVVEERISAFESDSAKVTEIKGWNDKLEAAEITTNRHTTLTLKDVELLWEQFKDFLSQKSAMLKDAIEIEKLRGITKEQLADIESNFKTYDVDQDGKLNKTELKTCLYSLGEEKTSKETVEILQKAGDESGMVYDSFKEYMISVLGVSDSKEDIVGAFDLINRGAEFTSQENSILLVWMKATSALS
eukprot:TRINITY_DN5077_c0_g1_i2.p1 TRINITY_DN5077_c0_g1~~TRINITY_DN5077_c0_g1_i2.p1  ORF type:complete len:1314 (-),score=365.62 TRINITY_DN5077_c0_g1_i2:124-3771(-)